MIKSSSKALDLLTKLRSRNDLYEETITSSAKDIEDAQGQVAAEWAEFLRLYQRSKLPISNMEFSTRTTRLLTKLIVNSGQFPSSVPQLTGISRGRDRLDQLEHALYRGGYGEVFKGSLRTQQVAIKRLRPLKDGANPIKAFVKETIFLWDLVHPNVVPFLGVSTQVEGFVDSLCMIFPWYKNGSLDTFLELHPHSPEDLLSWAKEIAHGMGWLHMRPNPVFHGDLRPANILLDDETHVRIADFGLSQLECATATTTKTTGAGTLQWKAPEMFLTPTKDKPLSHKSVATDSWAFGCTIYEMYDRRQPYHHVLKGRTAETWRVIAAIQGGAQPAQDRPNRPESRTSMDEELWNLVLGCWSRDPAVRPQMAKAESDLDTIIRRMEWEGRRDAGDDGTEKDGVTAMGTKKLVKPRKTGLGEIWDLGFRGWCQ